MGRLDLQGCKVDKENLTCGSRFSYLQLAERERPELLRVVRCLPPTAVL
jgi:hypothetical protein